MSRTSRDTFTCPICGQKNEYVRWRSLNSKQDPEAKQQLLDGKLFCIPCAKCRWPVDVFYMCLYHDMVHRAMVYMVDESEVKSTLAELKLARRLTNWLMSDYRMRIVTDANALREKAIIFEHELDDRVVEIIKAFYLSDALQQHPDIEKVFFVVDGGKYILEAFGDGLYHTEIEPDMYAGIRDGLAAQLEAAGDGEWVVDLNWALEFLKAKR